MYRLLIISSSSSSSNTSHVQKLAVIPLAYELPTFFSAGTNSVPPWG